MHDRQQEGEPEGILRRRSHVGCIDISESVTLRHRPPQNDEFRVVPAQGQTAVKSEYACAKCQSRKHPRQQIVGVLEGPDPLLALRFGRFDSRLFEFSFFGHVQSGGLLLAITRTPCQRDESADHD